jgi:hypothetical protein
LNPQPYAAIRIGPPKRLPLGLNGRSSLPAICHSEMSSFKLAGLARSTMSYPPQRSHMPFFWKYPGMMIAAAFSVSLGVRQPFEMLET